MKEIKYILYSILILAGAALTYAIMKPMVTSQWVAHAAITAEAGSAPAKTVQVKNAVGKSLFSANCQTCHSVRKTLTGPALSGVEERGPWNTRENLVKWTKNPAAFIPTTQYTRDLAVQYNGQVMPSFPHLSEEEINEIFDYIKEASEQPLSSVQ